MFLNMAWILYYVIYFLRGNYFRRYLIANRPQADSAITIRTSIGLLQNVAGRSYEHLPVGWRWFYKDSTTVAANSSHNLSYTTNSFEATNFDMISTKFSFVQRGWDLLVSYNLTSFGL